MTTLRTIAIVILVSIAIGIIAAWLSVPLLRDMPEPLPDRLRAFATGSGGFHRRCRADMMKPDEICTKEVMERQQREITKEKGR